jgi:hypothetical protein
MRTPTATTTVLRSGCHMSCFNMHSDDMSLLIISTKVFIDATALIDAHLATPAATNGMYAPVLLPSEWLFPA